MIIRWLGQACVVIKQTSADKQQTILVMDPYGEEVGFALPKLEARAVSVSHNHFDHNNAGAIGGNPFVINEPGEYEIAGFAIEAILSFHDNEKGGERGQNLIMRVETEEYSLTHFGDFGQDELNEEQLEALGEVDIVFIPVGGFYTIDGGKATKIINQLEPRVVIPIHYQIPKLAIKELAGPEEFFKAAGQEPMIIKGDWKVKAADLPSEGTKIVQLMPQNGVKN